MLQFCFKRAGRRAIGGGLGIAFLFNIVVNHLNSWLPTKNPPENHGILKNGHMTVQTSHTKQTNRKESKPKFPNNQLPNPNSTPKPKFNATRNSQVQRPVALKGLLSLPHLAEEGHQRRPLPVGPGGRRGTGDLSGAVLVEKAMGGP